MEMEEFIEKNKFILVVEGENECEYFRTFAIPEDFLDNTFECDYVKIIIKLDIYAEKYTYTVSRRSIEYGEASIDSCDYARDALLLSPLMAKTVFETYLEDDGIYEKFEL